MHVIPLGSSHIHLLVQSLPFQLQRGQDIQTVGTTTALSLQTLEASIKNFIAPPPSSSEQLVKLVLYDGTVELWNTAIGSILQTFKVGRHVYELTFLMNGRYLETYEGQLDISAHYTGSYTPRSGRLRYLVVKNDWGA